METALYLLPTGMSETSPADVLPSENIRILKGIRHFVVENIRTARRWIRKCDPEFSFDDVVFFELNEHTSPEAVWEMLEPLRKGMPMGVMSEAGCPAVADPGADLVAMAQKECLKVVPLVGPSSIIMGLMGSGFNGQSFCFHGYLPIDENERRQTLHRLEKESERENRTQIFIETPYRNERMLAMLADVLMPDTGICVACNITSPDEVIVTQPAANWKKIKMPDLNKRPAIFLIYRKPLGREGLMISGKGRRKKR